MVVRVVDCVFALSLPQDSAFTPHNADYETKRSSQQLGYLYIFKLVSLYGILARLLHFISWLDFDVEISCFVVEIVRCVHVIRFDTRASCVICILKRSPATLRLCSISIFGRRGVCVTLNNPNQWGVRNIYIYFRMCVCIHNTHIL